MFTNVLGLDDRIRNCCKWLKKSIVSINQTSAKLSSLKEISSWLLLLLFLKCQSVHSWLFCCLFYCYCCFIVLYIYSFFLWIIYFVLSCCWCMSRTSSSKMSTVSIWLRSIGCLLLVAAFCRLLNLFTMSCYELTLLMLTLLFWCEVFIGILFGPIGTSKSESFLLISFFLADLPMESNRLLLYVLINGILSLWPDSRIVL